ncbi:MAG: hypothetical protein ACRENS_02825, partial [Candidatus Eiseniibacteriota bacterium]
MTIPNRSLTGFGVTTRNATLACCARMGPDAWLTENWAMKESDPPLGVTTTIFTLNFFPAVPEG